MKRIVPLLLALLMLLFMCITAVAYTVPASPVENTSDLFDRDSEQLFAANGTPVVDGVVDDMWKNAFTYVNNAGTTAVKMNYNLEHSWTSNTTSAHSEVRLMWDEDNLYILEERFDENLDWTTNDIFTNVWTGGDQTMFNILLPTPVSEFGDAISHQIMFCVPQALTKMETVNGVSTRVPKAVGSIAPSVMYGREMQFYSSKPSVIKQYAWDFSTYRGGVYSDIRSYTAITATGYLQESVIPWYALSYGNYENLGYTGELGGEFGIKMYMNYSSDTGTKVYHINQYVYESNVNTSDWMGYAVVNLIDSVSEYITPDYSWYNKDETEFEIADAADLLGLVYLTHSWNKLAGFGEEDTGITLPTKPGDPLKNIRGDTEMKAVYRAYYDAKLAQDAIGSRLVTAGKTFKLTADIDLNPGYTGAANTRPANIWYGLLEFAGTFDGQGHTIKGLYNDATYGTGFSDKMAFVNSLASGGTIKNLTLEGSFIADEEDDILAVVAVKEEATTVENVNADALLFTAFIPHDHMYGNWSKTDEEQHEKECACGKILYADHTWDAGTVIVQPTHLTNGTKLFTCTDCSDTALEAIPKLTNHTYGDWTKKNDQQHQKVCACGDAQTSNHAWNTGTVIVEPTHLTNGIKNHTCSDCDATKLETVAKLTDHSYGGWTKKNDEQHQRECACGDIQTENHAWDNGIVFLEPTHLTNGIKIYSCSDCSATKTETVAKLTDHSYGDWEKKDHELHQKECACGDVQVANHAWDNGVVTIEPTHLATGVKTYTCSDCSATKTEELAKLSAEQSTQDPSDKEEPSGCRASVSGAFGLAVLLSGAVGIAFKKKKQSL